MLSRFGSSKKSAKILINNIKVLSLAVCISLSANSSFGMTIEETMATKPVNVSTLTHLKNNGVAISGFTDYESAYNLSLPTDKTTNILTKTIYDTTNFTTTSVDYAFDLNKKVYGEGSLSKTFTLTGSPINNIVIKYYYNSGDSLQGTKTNGNITGDYVVKYNSGSGTRQGGAIFNRSSSLGNINGNFIGNYTNSSSRYSHGGAIFNDNSGSIKNIKGDFISNYAYTDSSYSAVGGAVYSYNYGKIGNIIGNFINNHTYSTNGYSVAGAVENSSSTMGNIIGDFIGNYAISNSNNRQTRGGAIANETSGITTYIQNIIGDFIGNYAISNKYSVYGGAVYNAATINNLTGEFINNYANGYSGAYGGAIYNSGTLTLTNSKFDSNAVLKDTPGGAIYNTGTINITNTTFNPASNIIINGTLYNAKNDIYNGGTINVSGTNYFGSDISGSGTMNFNANNVSSTLGANVLNQNLTLNGGKLNLFTNSFSANNVTANSGIVNMIDESVKNYTISKLTSSTGTKYNIDVDLTDGSNPLSDKIISTGTSSSGKIVIDDINFIVDHNNQNFKVQVLSAKNSNIQLELGEKYSGSNSVLQLIDKVVTVEDDIIPATVYFDDLFYHRVQENNLYAAIQLATTTTTNDSIAINTVKEVLGSDNTALYTLSSLNQLNTSENRNFNFRTAKDKYIVQANLGDTTAGTLSINGVETNGERSTINGNNNKLFNLVDNTKLNINNVKITGAKSVVSGTNSDAIVNITNSEISGNTGGIQTAGDLNISESLISQNNKGLDVSGDLSILNSTISYNKEGIKSGSTLTIQNSSIIGNENGIESVGNMNITNSLISGQMKDIKSTGNISIINSIIYNNLGLETTGDVYIKNSLIQDNLKGIAVLSDTSKITLDAQDSPLNIKTSLTGVNGSKLDIKNGFVNFENKVNYLDIYGINSNISLSSEYLFDGNNLTLNSGSFNVLNNSVGTSNLKSLTINGDVNFIGDVDLANKTMDRITAETYGNHTGNLNVLGLNLISDGSINNVVTEILFADKGLKNNVVNKISGGTGDLPNSNYQTTFYTPIYKYNAKYENRDDGGYFLFTNGQNQFVLNGGTVSSGNPSDNFNPTVLTSSTTAQSGATGTMNQTFNYAFQNVDNFMTIPYIERLAIKNSNKYALAASGDSTDVGIFSPIFTKQEDASVWVKPYTSFESIPLKNGPKVSNITYGTLIGFDSEMQHLRRDWDRVWTGYIGYNGASQRYSGVDSTQNGALIGGTLTMYKGNFFNATTLSTGMNFAENQNMYGKDDFAMLLAGVGNKTGYNLEFNDGKFIVQPSMFLSYTFVNTFDYTNSAGVKIESKPLNVLQVSPGVKFIGNLDGGWQPYVGANMVWNLIGKSDVTANGIRLPGMSIKPYVQYGVGVQKRFKSRCMAFAQAMILNGGRNGISLTGGFRWALGNESAHDDSCLKKSRTPKQKPAKINIRTFSNQAKPIVMTDKKAENKNINYFVPAKK